MDLEGTQEFAVSRDIVWDHFFEPDVLTEAIPGAQQVEQVSENVFEGEVTRSLASISVTMQIGVEITDDDRPDDVIAAIEGTDNRTNSDVTGSADIMMVDHDDGSTLSYDATLNFTGRLASLGARLIKRQMMNDLGTFFENIEEHIEAKSESTSA